MVVLSCDPSESSTEAVHTSVYIAITNIVRATQPINLEKFVEVGWGLQVVFVTVVYRSQVSTQQINCYCTHAGTEVNFSPLRDLQSLKRLWYLQQLSSYF